MTKNVLLLASKSQSRHKLLVEAKIPFQIIRQEADESKCDWNLQLDEVVSRIARFKMEHAILPEAKEGDICFVITADTLSQDTQGVINGKPHDRDDAIRMIIRARGLSQLSSAFCLDRKKFKDGKWQIDKRIEKCVHAQYIFDIPDAWVDSYLEIIDYMNVSNAIAVEGYGEQFLKIMSGSYSAVVGLPMYELREALEEIGFF